MPTAPAKPLAPLWWRILRRVLIWIIVFLVAWFAVAFFVQRPMLFARSYTKPALEQKNGTRGLEEIWIDSPEGKVEAWFIPGNGVTKEKPGPAVIFAHGNAELIDDQPRNMEMYRSLGISVLLVEFRGYGRSAGSPSQSAITADFLKFHAALLARPEVDKTRIIYHGRSLGGAALMTLADKHPPAAMILESTFRSMTIMMKSHGVPPFLCRDPFDSEAVIRKLDLPILLMHGTKDTIVPHSHSVALKKLAKSATLTSYDCDHNNFPPDVGKYWEDVESFLRSSNMIDATRTP